MFSVKEKQGFTSEQISDRFDVPIRTLFRWQQCLEPCLIRNRPATKINMGALAKDVNAHLDHSQ